MSSEQARKEFEEWAVGSAWLGLGDESDLHQDADGKGYNHVEVHTAWLAWKASREAVVVSLPDGESLMKRMYGHRAGGPDRPIHRVEAVNAIESLGLKVKKACESAD